MSFVDTQNRQWTPEINVVTIARVRKTLDINLLELMLPDNPLAERMNDPCLVVDVLYLLCEEQVKRIDLSAEDFGRAMNADAIEQGMAELLEGLVLFSPSGIRPAHQKILEKARVYRMKAAQRIRELVTDETFDAMLEREIDKRLNPPGSSPTESSGDATSSPGSSALNPGETHSAA